MSKKFIISVSIMIVTVAMLSAISYSSQILNPFIGLKGLVQIAVGDEKVEKISDKPLRYISKSCGDFINSMESEGYTVEQMGRGFDLQKGNENKFLMSTSFMLIYEIYSEYNKR